MSGLFDGRREMERCWLRGSGGNILDRHTCVARASTCSRYMQSRSGTEDGRKHFVNAGIQYDTTSFRYTQAIRATDRPGLQALQERSVPNRREYLLRAQHRVL